MLSLSNSRWFFCKTRHPTVALHGIVEGLFDQLPLDSVSTIHTVHMVIVRINFFPYLIINSIILEKKVFLICNYIYFNLPFFFLSLSIEY
jgi:hypothetical protein